MTVPDPRHMGGISAYWQSLRPVLGADPVFLTVGRRSDGPSPIRRIHVLVSDAWALARLLRASGADVLQLNPSLDPLSLAREGLFLLIGKCMRRSVVVLIHGWVPSTEVLVSKRWSWLFRAVYGRADALLVLHSRFRGVLRSWGCSQPIHTTTSVVDPSCAQVLAEWPFADRSPAGSSLLFMARLLERKGIFRALDAFALAKEGHPELRLLVAGDGPDLERARTYASDRGLEDVTFLGDIRGERKAAVLRECNIYLLPTQHAEGMPTTVLEAMAFGLVSIVPLVAGLADFFDEELGIVAADTRAATLAELVDVALKDGALRSRISKAAHSFAVRHFLPSQVASRLEATYRDVRDSRPASDRDWYDE